MWKLFSRIFQWKLRMHSRRLLRQEEHTCPGGRCQGEPFSQRHNENGIVYIVGGGPGDPGLITVKGLECLRRGDVVLYDRLAAPELLDEVPAHAELIDVGKEHKPH